VRILSEQFSPGLVISDFRYCKIVPSRLAVGSPRSCFLGYSWESSSEARRSGRSGRLRDGVRWHDSYIARDLQEDGLAVRSKAQR